MLAVFKTGGKQYRVRPDDFVIVEKIEKGLGEKVIFEEVLLLSEGEQTKIGQPFIKGARVEAEVVHQFRGKKVSIIKMRRRKHHIKHQGHRQYLTRLKILTCSA